MAQAGLASVVINNFNYGRFLRSAIESALEQTYPQTEVIVVDDGSTDESRTVMAAFGSRIKAIYKQNGGQASALNVGFEASQGHVIIFLDADDSLLPTAVEKAIHCCRIGGVVKVHWPLWTVNEQGAKTGKIIPSAPLPDGDLRPVISREGPLCTASPPTSGNAWTRPLLEKLLPIPVEYTLCADEYLYALAPAFGIVKRVAEPQGTYRLHARNGYRGKPLEEKVAFGRRVQEMQCDVLAKHLRALGFDVAPERWKSRQWFCRLGAALRAIREFVPHGSTFILVDDEQWGAGPMLAERRCLPFLEKDGNCWGPPADDRTAIAELARMRRAGAEFLVFAWPAFWWREHYRAFYKELESKHACIVRTEELVVFDLRRDLTARPRM
jgi:glycosyltransferase involved in cell wall biosynthesis